MKMRLPYIRSRLMDYINSSSGIILPCETETYQHIAVMAYGDSLPDGLAGQFFI